MKEFKERVFNPILYRLDEMDLQDPTVTKLVKEESAVISVEPHCKKAMNKLNECNGMLDFKFSSTLWEYDYELWMSAHDKHKEETSSDRECNYAVVDKMEIVDVVNDKDYLTKLYEFIDTCKSKGMKVLYQNSFDGLWYNFYLIDKGGCGFVIRYYVNWSQFYFNNIYLDEKSNILYVTPVDLYPKLRDIDRIEIKLDVSYDMIMANALSTKDEYQLFIANLSKKISYQELFDLTKSFFGIKITANKDPEDLLTLVGDSKPELKPAAEVFKNFYQDLKKNGEWKYVYSAWLKRSVNFSNIEYKDIYYLMSKLVCGGDMILDILIRFIEILSKGKTNYDYMEVGV